MLEVGYCLKWQMRSQSILGLDFNVECRECRIFSLSEELVVAIGACGMEGEDN